MPAIRELFDLQSVDSEIDRDQQRLAEISKRLGNERPLARYRNEAATLEDAVRKITSRQREIEAAVAGLTTRVEAAEEKLYGGRVRNPRELQDLQADVAQLRRQRGEQESALLEVMDELETTQGKLAGAMKLLARAEKVWSAEQKEMARERESLMAELPALERDRAERAESIPAAELALYEQVKKGHGGMAVARVRNGTCQSCRVALPTRQAQGIKTSATPVRCPSCGLILFVE